jgi:hypothetical protein
VVATCLMGGANTALDKTDLLPLQGKHLEQIPIKFEHSPRGERNSCIPAR